MKKLLAIVLVSLSINAFATTTNKHFSVKFSGASEAEVMEKVEAALPSIQNGTLRSLRSDMRYEQCSPIRAKYIEIAGLGIGKGYVYANGEFTAVYTGILKVWHSNCWEPR
ncbi:MAG: hypothetical protein HON90_07210 [Halobacteriovoraceae bacterium]|jgi:hypothetical protein|nr:hypothetical protein [Halobacteriovoraceae bacterium]